MIRMDSIEEVEVSNSDISEDGFDDLINSYDEDIDKLTQDVNQLEASLETSGLKSSIPHTVCMTNEGPKLELSDDVTLTFCPKIDIRKDVMITGSPVKKRGETKQTMAQQSPAKHHKTLDRSVPGSPCKKPNGNKGKPKRNISLEEGKKEIEAKLREMRRSEIDQVSISFQTIFFII